MARIHSEAWAAANSLTPSTDEGIAIKTECLNQIADLENTHYMIVTSIKGKLRLSAQINLLLLIGIIALLFVRL